VACAEAAGSEWDDPVVIVCRLGPLSCHVQFRFDRCFLAPLSALARDFKQNRNHIRGKALRFVGVFCRAVGSPDEKNVGAKPKVPCRVRCPALNLQEIYGSSSSARLSPAFPEGWSAHRIKMSRTSGAVAGLRPNNPGAMRRQGESA